MSKRRYALASDFVKFQLVGVLEDDRNLVWNKSGLVLSLVLRKGEDTSILAQGIFTENESRLLLSLLENHPYHTPYENLHAMLHEGVSDEETLEKYRERIKNVIDTKYWQSSEAPIRDLLSRIRLKLKPFGVGISAIFKTGYILIKLKEVPK